VRHVEEANIPVLSGISPPSSAPHGDHAHPMAEVVGHRMAWHRDDVLRAYMCDPLGRHDVPSGGDFSIQIIIR
jgi:hypothetical protein